MSTLNASPIVLKPLTPWKGLLAAGGAIGFIVIIILLTARPGEHYLAGVMTGIGLVTLLIVYALTMTSRLVVSEEGIAYLTPVLNVTSSWDNIRGYGSEIMGIQTVEVLFLNQPAPVPALLDLSRKASPYLAVLALLTGRATRIGRTPSYERMIPVSLFDTEWRYGQIGEIMKRCAPEAYNNKVN